MIRLKNLRKYYGYSRDDLAKLLDISIFTLRAYEQGKREPNIATLIKIADLFNCTIDYLIGRDK